MTPEPYWSDGQVSLFLGDCLDVMREMPSGSVDSVVTDPPAAISFMDRSWDGDRGGRDQWIAWLAERMAEALRVLKPGGHALVWALPRTSGWTQMALEDAGFEVRDMICHLFGSAMPKSLNVAKAIASGGGRPEDIRRMDMGDAYTPSGRGRVNYDHGAGSAMNGGATSAALPPEAARWSGWGTNLKPGQEVWWLARKPLGGRTVAATVLEHGTGALNIAACRVGAETRVNNAGGSSSLQRVSRVESGYRPSVTASGGEASEVSGRWPANVAFTHSAACEVIGSRIVRGDSRAGQDRGTRPGGFGDVGASSGGERPNGSLYGDQVGDVFTCAPDCPVAELDRQSGARPSGSAVTGREPSRRMGGSGIYGEAGSSRPEFSGYADKGGASRFFNTFRVEQVCVLYGMLSGCGRVSGAAATSPPADRRQDAAVSGASASLSLQDEARPAPSTSSAPTAASPSAPMPATIPGSARAAAPVKSSDLSALRAVSAGSLCGSCATAIARSLAATQRGQSPMRTLGLPSTDAFSERILTQNLALCAEALAKHATTSTTTALTTSLGCVVAAISACTTRESDSPTRRSGPPLFRYAAKAPASERPRGEDGRGHECVKSLGLIRHFVRLVTPPGGTVLDLFAGSGPVGESAIIEGFNCILIDEDPHSAELVRVRLRKDIQPDLFGGAA